MRLPTIHWITNDDFACKMPKNGIGYDDRKFFLKEADAKQSLFGNFCKKCLSAAKRASGVEEK